MSARQQDSKVYRGENCDLIAYPMGGIGAGMICLKGCGGLSNVSLFHHHDKNNEPYAYAAVHIKGSGKTRVLEGPASQRIIVQKPASALGLGNFPFGLPRYAEAAFSAQFPFGNIELKHPDMPLDVKLTGWSPFIPNDTKNSSLPVAAVEYTFTNNSPDRQTAVFSFNAMNFTTNKHTKESSRVRKSAYGLVLEAFREADESGAVKQLPGSFAAFINLPGVKVNPSWFRGGWFDQRTAVWHDTEEGRCPENDEFNDDYSQASQGGTVACEFCLEPGKSITIPLQFAWYMPESEVKSVHVVEDDDRKKYDCYKPWYSVEFDGIDAVGDYWKANYAGLRARTEKFTRALYANTLPPEVTDAIDANLTILKSPTVLREKGGRLWCWEGCCDCGGCCSGSCTHVWNYAQVLPHLFPEFERSLRQTEFNEAQFEDGFQNFRHNLPISQAAKKMPHAASDGQLGGLMKLYREWRIKGDDAWLKEFWPKAKTSLDYCIATWDPEHAGVLVEPHHNTYDIEFWGPDGMCSSFYLGALKAASLMGAHLGEATPLYDELYARGRKYLENELFNGEYFEQKIVWEGLRAKSPADTETLAYSGIGYSPEAAELLKQEGPKYQYGRGCLSDGVLGAWMAEVCGVGEILDPEKVKSHLLAVYKYNLKRDLTDHVNPQRASYAFGGDGGLLLCTWPHGGRLALPFVYSEEVWTGIEYQVASHLMLTGCVNEGLEIVRILRQRHDGSCRNPYNEYECGHWYARAMASYGLLQGLTGISYDAAEKTLHIAPRIKGDFTSFLSTATGYGLSGVENGKPFVKVCEGTIETEKIEYTACE
ncbi:MAG: GH116 family glycosyl hydrolase [Victivallaceae bacterium]|jgi:uncharacterized protein (DUF608 family)